MAIFFQAHFSQGLFDGALDLFRRFVGVQAMKGHGEIFIQREGVKEGCALEEITHFAPDFRKPVFLQRRHVFSCHQDFSSVCFEQPNHQLQGHTFAGAASAQDAECFSPGDGEGHFVQNLSSVKTLLHLLKCDRDVAARLGRYRSYGLVRKKEEDAFHQDHVREDDHQR